MGQVIQPAAVKILCFKWWYGSNLAMGLHMNKNSLLLSNLRVESCLYQNMSLAHFGGPVVMAIWPPGFATRPWQRRIIMTSRAPEC